MKILRYAIGLGLAVALLLTACAPTEVAPQETQAAPEQEPEEEPAPEPEPEEEPTPEPEESAVDRAETEWTDLAPSAGPSPRHEHNMAYDAESDRIILFGGLVEGFEMEAPIIDHASDETWAYDFNSNTWTQMDPPTSPSPRLMHAMAYDAESDRVILFGGIPNEEPETWAYDFNIDAWTDMTPAVQPEGYVQSRVVYDAQSDRIILFGGDTENTVMHRSPTKDTWAYDFNSNTWTQMEPEQSPSARVLHGMAYDAGSDRVLLFGGFSGQAWRDTWAYDFDSDTWTEMSPPESPLPRHGHGMGYHAALDRMVIFGGSERNYEGGNETWIYDLEADTWMETNQEEGPPNRRTPNLVYDAESECIIRGVFPATVDQFHGDTWGYGSCGSPEPG